MVNPLISARTALMEVNRQVSKLTASTIAPGEDPPAGISGNTKAISTQPAQLAQLSTLGGFKNALAEFRNAATTLTALAKVLALKPLFTDSLPKAANPAVDSASLKPANRPQAGSTTAATAGSSAMPSPSAAVLTQAIQTFVATHNQLVTVLTHLANPGEASTLELPTTTSGEATPESSPSGVTQQRASLNTGNSPALPLTSGETLRSPGDPLASKPTAAQPGGNDQLPGHVVAPADLGKQARRLLDTLTMVTARLPGLQAVGLTSGQEGELRLDAGRLQAAMVAQPRTIARLFSTIDLNPDEAQRSPPSPSLRSSGAATAASPLATLNAALTDFQEKTRIVTGLARLLAHPTPVAERSPGQAVSAVAPELTAPLPKTASGQMTALTTQPVKLGGSAPVIETLYLNPEETLLSTALPRAGDRLAPLTLQFQSGRYDAVAQRFLADPQHSPVNVALSDGNDTLPGLRDAIQGSNPDLGAAVVKDNAGYRLAMRLPGETMAHSIAVSISKAANLPAVAGEGQPLGFNVQRDADAVRNAVQSLVGAYNRLNTAASSLSGDLQAQALAGPLRQSLAGSLANSERSRVLAQTGVIVQRDGSLLIEPIRLSTAVAAHPKQVLDLFVNVEGGEDDESGTTGALADSFSDWLAEIRDGKEPWDSQRDDQSPEAALNPDGGQGSDGRQTALEMRYRTRLEAVNRLTQRLFANELWLRQELERLPGWSASAAGMTVVPD